MAVKVKSNQALVEHFVTVSQERSSWTFEELVTEVNSKTCYKDPFILTVTLKSLCFGGVLDYEFVRTDKPQGIRYQMPNANKQLTYINLIRNFLLLNPEREYSQEEIVLALKDQVDGKGNYIIEYPLMIMVAAGLLGGRIYNGKVCDVKWKEAAGSIPSGEPMVPRKALEDALRRFKDDTEKLKAEHIANTMGLQKSLEATNEYLTAARKELSEAQGKERIVKIVVEHHRGAKKTTKEHEATFHSKFEKLLKLAQARQEIFIYGPTGSGKSFIGKQMAEVLGLPFYFVSCSQGTSESALTGRLLPGQGGNFEYWESEFVKAYENGGVFLIDEIDAADANVLLVINTALANGRFAIPRRDKPYAERHPDFVCIAAANTLGGGSDRMYSGRSKLDISTMSRFGIGKVLIDYDENVEKTLCPDEALRAHLLRYRKSINANRLERAMDSRFMEKAFKMHTEFGYSYGDIDESFFLGWREDEVNKVKNAR